jgi:hypothetical protein
VQKARQVGESVLYWAVSRPHVLTKAIFPLVAITLGEVMLDERFERRAKNFGRAADTLFVRQAGCCRRHVADVSCKRRSPYCLGIRPIHCKLKNPRCEGCSGPQRRR